MNTSNIELLKQALCNEHAADKLVRSYVSAVTENKRDDAIEATQRMVDYVLNKLPTEPPKREWVGLTDEEIDYWVGNNGSKKAILAVEAILKEKNA